MVIDFEKARLEFEARDYAAARVSLLPLAESGNVEAQCMLANIHHLGLGIAQDAVQAIEWYERATARGSALACNNLWSNYAIGMPGVAADREKARKWHDEARRIGFPRPPREFSAGFTP